MPSQIGNSERADRAPASQRQQRVKVHGIEDLWASKTGGEVTADVATVWDGGKLTPVKLSAPATTGNIVVGRPYYPRRDGLITRQLRRFVGRRRFTVSVQDTDADLVPIGQPTVYSDALLVRCTPPDHDASSSDAGTMELEFAVEE